jgi:hypothetical protein
VAGVRRLLLAIAEPGDNAAKLDQLHQQVATTGKTSDEWIAVAAPKIWRFFPNSNGPEIRERATDRILTATRTG